MKPRSKLIILSVVLAAVLAVTGGLLLKNVQAGAPHGPVQMAPHGMGSDWMGHALVAPPHPPKIVERDTGSNCDRLFYKLKGGMYERVYLRCRFGNGTMDYGVNYRSLFNFFAGLEMTATVGTDPAACAASTSVIAPDGATVYYCYTATNTGNIALPLHTLEDSVAGTIFSGEVYTLDPGASINTVDLGVTISETVTAPQSAPLARTGTWTGYVDGGVSTTASASATVDVAALEMVKTVSVSPNTCGATNVITPTTVPAWARYCYTVNNIGSVTLPVHSVVDSNLGPILSGFAYDLGPGQSYYTITAVTSGLTESTSNVATWTASVDSVSVTDTATATVNIP